MAGEGAHIRPVTSIRPTTTEPLHLAPAPLRVDWWLHEEVRPLPRLINAPSHPMHAGSRLGLVRFLSFATSLRTNPFYLTSIFFSSHFSPKPPVTSGKVAYSVEGKLFPNETSIRPSRSESRFLSPSVLRPVTVRGTKTLASM